MSKTEKKHLSTGTYSFEKRDGSKGYFGLALGRGAPHQPGQIHISLWIREQPMKVIVTDETIDFVMPEDWASELAKVVGEVAVQLKHLRTLHKFGYLSEAALREEEDGAGEPSDDEEAP